ncbi:hypothetical protein HPB50_014835 [Hyalomma asiaticum]|uniref:Uncharacterized protein n=1 Tax=Hyalomma asiaticum TaxID=266040 RepID=A0ACB7SWB7_HYAAI|nr:hypothetical protein HPB50_014835 [Hyalomma asiaticum]
MEILLVVMGGTEDVALAYMFVLLDVLQWRLACCTLRRNWLCAHAELRSDGDGMESQPREVRRPKFVPHEPYKAAVTCERTRLTALEIPFPLYQAPSCEPPLLAVVREVPEGATPPSSSGDPLEQRLHEMHQCNQDLQEQLRVQVEVNRELKKLLVASVGEDLEARVHFLSEDKAQLAADVRAYAQRLSQGREEIDRLAIHADVWRSKFLAASANAVQRTLEEPPRSEHQVPNTEGEANTSLEDEGEGEQDAQAFEPLATNSMSGLEQGQLESQNSVGKDIIEDSERLGPVTESSFAEEQKRDESLADAWHQAKEGSTAW